MSDKRDEPQEKIYTYNDLLDLARQLERELAKAEAENAALRMVMLYYRDECSGSEPSLSVFHRMIDAVLAKDKT